MKPHADQTVLQEGVALSRARAAMVMIHGRGSSADSILRLQAALDADGIAYRAPQASGGSWYPLPFMSPIRKNEPGISSALWVIGQVLNSFEEAGIPRHKCMLLGFSQGACLVLEYAARYPRRYGAVFGLSGGLIGPAGTEWKVNGSLDGTPVFLGCSDIDFHIPKTRVQETSQFMRQIGADVTQRLYPGMPHTVNSDEVSFMQSVIQNVIEAP